jgi:sacsin
MAASAASAGSAVSADAAAAAAAASLGDDFGQRVDLTVRLRELLRGYPEGTSVLRELAQNAADAGARSLAQLLDLRTHAAASLFAPGMRALHAAPALLAYNDAAFTARDFAAIQRIGDSSKREDSAGAKTGRFGLGFSSVFHLTDVPAFVSGSSIVFLDPMACHLPGVNPADPGKLFDWRRAAHAPLFERFADQLCAPFAAFGCDVAACAARGAALSLIHISEPTRLM